MEGRADNKGFGMTEEIVDAMSRLAAAIRRAPLEETLQVGETMELSREYDFPHGHVRG